MKFRPFWGFASIALAVGLGGGGCSAPDPGEIDNAPAYNGGGGNNNNSGGGNNNNPGNGNGNGSSDAGSGGSSANVFTSAAAYQAGQAKEQSNNPSHTFASDNNPAGHNCVGECHNAKSTVGAVQFAFGGTVYTAKGSSTAVGAGVEVRVGATSGDNVTSVYTDQFGNFFILASAFTLPSGSQAGVRNANGQKTMPASNTVGSACENCHDGTKNPRIFAP